MDVLFGIKTLIRLPPAGARCSMTLIMICKTRAFLARPGFSRPTMEPSDNRGLLGSSSIIYIYKSSFLVRNVSPSRCSRVALALLDSSSILPGGMAI